MDTSSTPPDVAPTSRLTRPREGRVVAGVAAALAPRLGLDLGLVRLLFVITSFMGGLGAIVYAAAWALLPDEGEAESPVERRFGQD